MSDESTSPRDEGPLRGIAGSPGIAVGTVVIVGSEGRSYPRRLVPRDLHDAELERFRRAVERAQRDLKVVATRLGGVATAQSVIEAYGLMVQDPLLAEEVERRIRDESRGAEWAVALAIEHLAAQLARAHDPYLRERSRDVEFVGEHILRAFAQAASGQHRAVSGPVVVVARDLSPADTACLASPASSAGLQTGPLAGLAGQVVAFITERGSRTSHTALTARALKLPAVVGVTEVFECVSTGDQVVVDGLRGHVLVEPDPELLRDSTERADRYRAHMAKLASSREGTLTRDGAAVAVRANVELPEEAAEARAFGADGVGLYRTEYLYVDRVDPPTEEEQLAAFRAVVEAMGTRPVVLRTFDIGGDKFVSTFKLPPELNPMLGLRAVRLALERPEILLTHLRAMVRASAGADVRIMVPLVSRLEELRQVRDLLDRAIAEVRAAGMPVADTIPLGVMIEVPSAALLADHFAREAAFLSIGTNDLIQYTMAVDRSSRRLAYLASPFDPSIVRLVNDVVRAGAEYDRPVSVCGAMASDPLGALLLLGLGVRELSMEVAAIPEIRETIRRVSLAEVEAVASEALTLPTAAEVEGLLSDTFGARLADLLDG